MQKNLNQETVDLECELVRDTPGAVLVMSEYDKEVWLPRAALTDFKDNKNGTCKFTCAEQFAVEKGLV